MAIGDPSPLICGARGGRNRPRRGGSQAVASCLLGVNYNGIVLLQSERGGIEWTTRGGTKPPNHSRSRKRPHRASHPTPARQRSIRILPSLTDESNPPHPPHDCRTRHAQAHRRPVRLPSHAPFVPLPRILEPSSGARRCAEVVLLFWGCPGRGSLGSDPAACFFAPLVPPVPCPDWAQGGGRGGTSVSKLVTVAFASLAPPPSWAPLVTTGVFPPRCTRRPSG